LRIERARRLVQQQQRRLVGKCPGECQTLALAGGERRDRAVEHLWLKSERMQETVDATRRCVRERRARRVRPPRGLGRAVAHVATPRVGRHLVALRAVEEHLAGRRIEVGDGAQEQRLAGARRSLDGEALAGGHLEGEGRQRARLQMPDAQHGFGALLVVGRHEP
jgi:hypothetical protein